MIVARLPNMKKSYHSIIVPAVDAAMTRQIPFGAFSCSGAVCMALILETQETRDNLGACPIPSIDLNADIGEHDGYDFSTDIAILSVISSANIACGVHAGSRSVM